MAMASTSSSSYYLFTILLFMTMVPLLVSSTQFRVGGDLGCVRPPKNDSDMYNAWAALKRFHVGDTIYFKYKKDSVLLVEKEDYENCEVSNPISKFSDGKTVFQFENHGFYYFISGQLDHCKSGQKMVIRVMVQSGGDRPKNSPPPERDEGDKGHNWDSDEFGPPGFNATTRLSVATCFMTALVAMFIFTYLFV